MMFLPPPPCSLSHPLAPAWRAAACLLVAALALLLSAGFAEAQSSVKLVSNTGQADHTAAPTFFNDHAQGFRTGSNPDGYTLTQVDVPMTFTLSTATPPTYTVKIHSESSGGPGGTIFGTLTNPTTLVDGTNSFTTAGIKLEPNTMYFVILDVSGTGGNHHKIQIDNTLSNNEDAGKAAGWSIEDTNWNRQFDSSGSWVRPTYSWKIAIHGIVRTPAPPAAPAAPTVSKTDGTSLTVTWTEPANAIPAVTDYDVRYRRKGDTAWTDHPHEGTALTTTITGLMQGASWEAQVAASNDAGPGRWSASGSGHTGPARFVRAETNVRPGIGRVSPSELPMSR